MSYRVRYTRSAKNDIKRLYRFLLEYDIEVAQRALKEIEKSIEFLRNSPFACRKAVIDNPFLREILISFGASGYVVLFEIENAEVVTILAIRHQREQDYY